MNKYVSNVKDRSAGRYLIGYCVRLCYNIKYALCRMIARRRGATIGEGCILNWKLAKRANKNLIVGDHCSIDSWDLDLRSPIEVGNHVIIGTDTKIITVSHNVDSKEWEAQYYGVKIGDYCWIPNNIIILPQCRHIGNGAVVGTGSVVTKDLDAMTIYGGNPARAIRRRENIHSELVVESLRGGDFSIYKSVRNGCRK